MSARAPFFCALTAFLAFCAAPALEAAPPKKGHLDLVVDRTEHDFGIVEQDTVSTTTITYTNKSDKPVAGIRARGSCGCNTVVLSHDELAPGESGTLTIEFDTLMLGGRLEKSVRLASRDYRRGSIVIPLKIAIIKGMVVGPASVSYGNVLVGTKPSKSLHLKWYEGHGKPFEVTAVEVPGFDFETRIEPYQYVKDAGWRGWTVHVGFKEPPPIGMFSAEVLVRTTDERRPRLTLPLSANVCGKVWMQSRTLSFGAFDRGTRRTASLKFRPFDETIVFGEVHARARHGRIDVEVVPDPRHAKKGYWRLSASVPLDTPVGSLDEEVIELHTGAPGEEVTLIKVRGTVREPRD